MSHNSLRVVGSNPTFENKRIVALVKEHYNKNPKQYLVLVGRIRSEKNKELILKEFNSLGIDHPYNSIRFFSSTSPDIENVVSAINTPNCKGVVVFDVDRSFY